jgi:hypothetical protein
MLPDDQPSMQAVGPYPAIKLPPRDLLVIVAFVLCLLASSWLSFRFCRAFLLFSMGHTAVVPLIASFLLYTARGLLHFFCGYWLAKLLQRVSPWYVVGGLAIGAALLILVLMGLRTHLDILNIRNGSAIMAAPFFLALDVFGQDCPLLFLSLGIWCQRRTQRRTHKGR